MQLLLLEEIDSMYSTAFWGLWSETCKEDSKGHSSRRPLWHLPHLVQGVSLPTSACKEEIRDEKYYYCKISTCRPALITEGRAKRVIIAKNDLGYVCHKAISLARGSRLPLKQLALILPCLNKGRHRAQRQLPTANWNRPLQTRVKWGWYWEVICQCCFGGFAALPQFIKKR